MDTILFILLAGVLKALAIVIGIGLGIVVGKLLEMIIGRHW